VRFGRIGEQAKGDRRQEIMEGRKRRERSEGEEKSMAGHG
jgi:hypothetical protein